MNCYNHPGTEATSVCVSCNRAICPACSIEVQGKTICRQCLAAGKYAIRDTTDITDNDRTMGMLAYILGTIVPLIILLSEASKKRPYQRFHAVNSLMLTGATVIVSLVLICPLTVILSVVTLGIGELCILPIYLAIFGLEIYYGVKANQGIYFDIPVLTNLARGWKWL